MRQKLGFSNSSASSASAAQTDPDTSEADSNNKNKSKNSIINGFKTVAGHYTRRLGDGMNKLPLAIVRGIRKGATYGLGAATFGAVGLAAGIASGDPTKAFQYTMAAGAVGGSIGKNLGDAASNLIGLEEAKNAFEAGYFGENYRENQLDKVKREFKGSASNYTTALSKVGKEGWGNMTTDGGIIDQAIEYGINDIETMCNIYQLTQKPYGLNTTDAFRAYKLNKQFGDIEYNSETVQNLDKILDSKGYSAEGKSKMKKEVLGLINSYKKVSLD